ncbi:response regulator transcription factor [Arthrobacter sulfonylureivorans]|uniref:Response regulator transcription factor n=1 Tax=Arthrobacter sulfonylureivorans TaxID=2486855 RepID=A0ABY3W6D1_9MICC|nr:response regulator transcription factor [Arthrobacter sulfonylureivorans]UNK45546.1 response regulator transcription factor [Arthrobacter sulfonylureivorans]
MIHQILVVEDDDGIALPLLRTLDREGYHVDRVSHGIPALDHVRAGGTDLVILDLGLPDIDGLEVCRRLREDGFGGGVLILTARGGELDRVVGLDVGADDYMAKPFGLAELLARTRALLRRHRTDVPSSPAESARPGMEVDSQARRAQVGGRELPLTAKEFDVLALLHTEPGTVFTRERLMDTVWDENWYGSTKTLDVTIGRLRQKLEEHGAPARVTTVRGVGFRLEPIQTDA